MSAARPAIRLVRVLPAAPEAVFDAWTDPASLREWLCPGPVTEALAELDVRVGGAFRIVMRTGLRGWWTADSVAEPRVGTIAEFGFYRRANLFRMRVERLEPGRRVVWTCLGEHDDWKDTRLEWEILPEDGGCLLRFVHGNWRAATGFFALCNTTWGELTHRLKAHAETGRPDPRWTE